MLWGAFAVISENEINKIISDSSIRATIMSIGNALSNAFASILVFFYGFALKSFPINKVVMLIGIIMLISGIVIVILKLFKTSSQYQKNCSSSNLPEA
jgi:hypothetical protein